MTEVLDFTALLIKFTQLEQEFENVPERLHGEPEYGWAKHWLGTVRGIFDVGGDARKAITRLYSCMRVLREKATYGD